MRVPILSLTAEYTKGTGNAGWAMQRSPRVHQPKATSPVLSVYSAYNVLPPAHAEPGGARFGR